MAEFSKQETFFFGALAASIIILCLGLIFFTLIGRTADTYSELSFDPTSIKGRAVQGEQVPIVFFVENHEGAEMNYTYAILVGSEEAKAGQATLFDGEKREISETVPLSDSGKQKIEVRLQNSLQEQYSIFFWITVSEQK